jgi:hypothetical protein
MFVDRRTSTLHSSVVGFQWQHRLGVTETICHSSLCDFPRVIGMAGAMSIGESDDKTALPICLPEYGNPDRSVMREPLSSGAWSVDTQLHNHQFGECESHCDQGINGSMIAKDGIEISTVGRLSGPSLSEMISNQCRTDARTH